MDARQAKARQAARDKMAYLMRFVRGRLDARPEDWNLLMACAIQMAREIDADEANG